MIKNFKELISQIKSQVPIQELISEFIPVKKSGRGFVAVCPFHDDHKPSLQIHPQKGIFKCFSCGTGGDVITFYALYNKKNWAEAIPELALKYGLKVEYGEENKAENYIKSQLYELNKLALEFFKRNLFSSNETQALEYVKNKRKLSNEIIDQFQIGFALNSWDGLFNYLTKEKKYPQETILASGLFVVRENQQGYYDRFRNRIIFPICNEKNDVIAFGGRTLSNDDAKYINSPETLLYSKGQNLYGLNFAKDEIKNLDYAILTEGYLDVITAHQNGLRNTVASLGTALTLQQARLLSRYTNSKKIHLCLDSDAAGKKAVENIFKIVQDINRFITLDIKVSSDLPAKDLDESLNITSPEEVKNKILNGQTLIYFILDRFIDEYNKSEGTINKKEALNNVIETILSIKDPFEQKESIKYISHKLNIDEDLINQSMKDKNRNHKQKFTNKSREQKQDSFDSLKMHTKERFLHAEQELLLLYIHSFPNKDEIREELKSIDFIDDKNKLLKEYIDTIAEEITPDEVINNLLIEFSEFKHLAGVISELAIKLDNEGFTESTKSKTLTEAKEWISWWVKNKQKLKLLTDKLKDCTNKTDENTILQEMVEIVKNNNQDSK